MVEIKTVDSMNAKNAKIDVSKNVMNDMECQRMSENGQSKVGSVSDEIMKNDKQNVKNGVSGLKEVTTEFLDTNSRKKNFKIFNISKLHLQKKVKLIAAGIFCQQYLNQQN